MKSRLRLAVLVPLLAAIAAVSGVARGQGYDDYDYYDDDDQIRQTVARLAHISGDVSFARGDDPDYWQRADPNFPMTLGDRIWTAGGRLELQVHGGHMIRLASRTDLTALNLTEYTKQFSLAAGIGSFHIRRLGNDEIFEVDTPNAAITFERPGDYRVDVRPDGDTRFVVRRGRAIIASAGGQIALSSGDAILIEGYDVPRYDVVSLPHPDGWDGWVASRDARYGQVRSYDYVSADIAGVGDLDYYGRWQQVPNYGWCWAPTSVSSGWAPYRVGRWIWQDPWGWTWVSSEPWGWAPYHYGRWVTHSSRWYWVPVAPGVSVVAYSPALVAFVGGGGPGISLSVGFGSGYVGWFPLAPRDPLIPWWGRPQVNVNVTNITYVNRTYVTVVNQKTFVDSRSVANNIVRDRNVITRAAQAPVVRGTVPMVPTRESIRVSTRQTTAARPPAAVQSRAVVTRLAAPPAPPRFDRKIAVIRESKAPVSRREAARLTTSATDTPRASRPVRAAASQSGRVALQPKTENSRAPRAEPLAPVRGRPMATTDRPVAAPPASRQSGDAREREAREAQTARERATRETQTREAESAQQDRAARDAAERDQAARERATRETQAREAESAQRERAARDAAQRDQAARDAAQREKAARDQAAREKAARDSAARDQAQRERATRDQAARDQAAREKTERDAAARDQQAREQAARDQESRKRTSRPAPAARPESSERSAPARPESSERVQPAPRSRDTQQPAERVSPRSADSKKESETTPSRKAPERGRGRPEPTKTPD